ncbi:MAG: hypothetical protein JO267_09995 [Alphaproteobacteria bacterium]|nr:hypothetical protein [Alphaproteobacteria bacterium]MBV9862464.1 hypothetical protein [Alphaproteobacteria bacterium]
MDSAEEDVIVVGAGNAATCATVSAREPSVAETTPAMTGIEALRSN